MTPIFDRRTILLAATATLLPVRNFPAFAQADQKMTPDEARTLTRDAWVFGMPLVYIEKQIDTLTYVTKPEGHSRRSTSSRTTANFLMRRTGRSWA
jgi:hypothetical protein